MEEVTKFKRHTLVVEESVHKQFTDMCKTHKVKASVGLEVLMESYGNDPENSVYKRLQAKRNERAKQTDSAAIIANKIKKLSPEEAMRILELVEKMSGEKLSAEVQSFIGQEEKEVDEILKGIV